MKKHSTPFTRMNRKELRMELVREQRIHEAVLEVLGETIVDLGDHRTRVIEENRGLAEVINRASSEINLLEDENKGLTDRLAQLKADKRVELENIRLEAECKRLYIQLDEKQRDLEEVIKALPLWKRGKHVDKLL